MNTIINGIQIEWQPNLATSTLEVIWICEFSVCMEFWKDTVSIVGKYVRNFLISNLWYSDARIQWYKTSTMQTKKLHYKSKVYKRGGSECLWHVPISQKAAKGNLSMVKQSKIKKQKSP